MESITEHISNLETRLQRSIVDSNPEVIASLQRIESKVASTRIRNRLPLAQGQHMHTRYCLENLILAKLYFLNTIESVLEDFFSNFY